MDYSMVDAAWILKVTVLLSACCLLVVQADVEATDATPANDTQRGDLENQQTPGGEAELQGDAHFCYECFSERDGDKCHDPMDEDKRNQMMQKECNATREEFSCYKVVTFYKAVNADEDDEPSIITSRMCASWDGGDSSWSHDGGSGRWTKRSYCNDKLCNNAHVTYASAITGILTIVAAFLLS